MQCLGGACMKRNSI